MVAMLSRMCSLLRQDGHQQWGFWIQGGRDQGRPITINKVALDTIAEIRGLRLGDTVLQIGRERTVDMTHVDAENAVKRAGNRLDILVLRPADQTNSAILVPQKEDKQTPIRAIVHKQTNSPIGLYSPENIADTFIEQTKVLTKGALKLQRNPQSIARHNLRNMQAKSDVYRMVHEEDSSGKFTTSPEPIINRPYVYGRSSGISGASSPNLQSQSFHKLRHSLNEKSEEYTSEEEETDSASPAITPTPTLKKQQAAPAPPPKPSSSPVHPHHPQQHGGGQPQANHQTPQQRQQQQYQPRPQQTQPQPPQYQPRPQQTQPQPRPQQTQPQQYQPRPQQTQPQQQQYQPQQRQQQQSPPQRQQQQSPQQQQHYQQQNYYQQTQQYQRREEEDYSDRPKYQPYPQAGSPQKPAQVQPRPASSSTFQTQIPFVQNSSSSPQFGEHEAEQIQWSPTTGRRRPVWPPQKQEPVLSTSAQSMKFAGGRPSKQFIWPPPKDFVEVTEEVQGDQRSVIYRHVPDGQANKARVYVSPRAPARLAAEAWEPYSQESQAQAWLKASGPSKRLRRFDDIFSSNSTPLPPTYRAPPGTFHVAS